MADVETCVPAGAAVDPRTMLRRVVLQRTRPPPNDRAGHAAPRAEAGRYTATAKNARAAASSWCRWTSSTSSSASWDGIEGMLAPCRRQAALVKLYKPFLVDAQAYAGLLFRNAPAVRVRWRPSADDAGLAAQNMELVAASLGLRPCSTATCAARPRSFRREGVPRSGNKPICCFGIPSSPTGEPRRAAPATS